jgi:hypothetical protein
VGLDEAPEGFSDDEDGGHGEGDAVDESGENLSAAGAEGSGGRTWALGDALSHEGKGQSRRVREHVAGVGNEGEAPGEPPGDGFGEHEGDGQDEGDSKAPGRGSAVVVVVVMIVGIVVRMVVIVGVDEPAIGWMCRATVLVGVGA